MLTLLSLLAVAIVTYIVYLIVIRFAVDPTIRQIVLLVLLVGALFACYDVVIGHHYITALR
jgi:hypothetical protein